MKNSLLTKLLRVIETVAIFLGARPDFLALIKVLLKFSEKLDTDAGLWSLISSRLEVLVPPIAAVLMLRYSTVNAPNVPFIVQFSFVAIVVPYPLYRAIRIMKTFPQHRELALGFNAIVTFVAYFAGMLLAFYVLTVISPTPENLNFRAALFIRVLSIAPSLLSAAITFGCLVPYIVMELCRMYDATNLENRSKRLEQ